MGIQIFIKKERLAHTSTEELIRRACKCGCESEGYCNECNSSVENTYLTVVKFEGLEVEMYDHGTHAWSDANAWGSNRKPIIDFIEAKSLVEDVDWFQS
jgi:hypothetical protein